MSRTVCIDLPARQGAHLAEAELRAKGQGIRPQMLGAMLTCLAGGLRELPRVAAAGEWRHRLVDFDQMGEAVCAAAGLQRGRFLDAVGKLRESMARRSASGDVFLMALLAALRRLAEKPTHAEPPTWNSLRDTEHVAVYAYEKEGCRQVEVTARSGPLRAQVKPVEALPFGRENPMPGTNRAFVDAVRRVQPLLTGLGVSASEYEKGGRIFLKFTFPLERVRDV